VPRTRVAPEYPFNLRRAEVRGEVLVEFVVDPAGNVIAAYPVRSTNAGFDAAAVAAVQQWKFQPGMKGGKAVNAKLRVPIVFNLND
jgi:protein TonB